MRHIGQEVAAAIAVAPDELDALGQSIGHGVELDRELAELRRAGTELGGRDPASEVAFGERTRCIGQLADRRREPAGEGRRYHHRQTEREERDRGEQTVTLGQEADLVVVAPTKRSAPRVSTGTTWAPASIRRRQTSMAL